MRQQKYAINLWKLQKTIKTQNMRKFYLVILLMVAAFGLNAESLLDNAAVNLPEKSNVPEVYTLHQAKVLGVKFNSVKKDKPIVKSASMKAASISKYAHGFGLDGYVSFPLTSPSKAAVDFDYTLNFSAGTRAGNDIMLVEYTLDSRGSMHSTYLTKFDLKKQTYSRIAKLDYDGPMIVDMAYSEATGKLFGLGVHTVNDNGLIYSREALYTINTTTGECVMIGDDFDTRYMAIAATRGGLLYVVDKSGNLSVVDPNTRYVTKIGSSGLTKTATYISGMDMDCDANMLYWALCDANGYSYLVKIDPTNGAGKVVGRIGSDKEEVIAMHIDRTEPNAAAPAKVANLSAVADANGATSATISWTNPAKTISGDALASLEKVEVYVNDKLYKTLNTAPGAENSVQISGLVNNYNRFAVVTYNGGDKSDVAEVMTWVGQDIPRAVTDVTLERTNAGLATLKWNAPKGSGLHGGFVKTSALKYRITRKNVDGDSVVVAKTYRKDCTYLDSTITKLSQYTYTIQSLTTDYGESTVSPAVVLGPAAEVPYSCIFQSDAVFRQWTTYDNNNDGKCWTDYAYGKYVFHVPAGVKADDWLISPPVKMKADSTYYIYFEFRSGLGEYYPKHIQVTYGKSNDYRDQKVLAEYKFASRKVEQARIALPISADGEYYVGIHDVSNYNSCNVSLTNFCIIVKHTGWVKGKVTDENGKPVEGVAVTIPNSNIVDTTSVDGSYMLDFVPTGKYAVKFSKLYWKNTVDSVKFENDKETIHNAVMTMLPKYKVSGEIKDVNGKKIVNARLSLTGYGDDIKTTTDENGKFTVENVAEHGYRLKINKIKYINISDTFDLNKDTVLSYTMSPKLLAPSEYKVTAAEKTVSITWKTPRDVFRHDNGIFESQLGSLAGTEKTVHGAVFRTPAVLKSISWVTTSYQGPHNEINLWIFDVTPDQKPTNKVLFNAMNVKTKGDEVWNTYELPEAVEAPNGYFLGVSYSKGMSSLATDSGTDEDYPFIPSTNYSTADYTTNKWSCADASFIKRNHLIRATGDEIGANPQGFDYKYVVWRFAEDDFLDKDKWTMLTPTDGVSGLKLDDDIASLPKGEYVYAIAAVYPDGEYSEVLYSDNVKVDQSGVEAVQLAADFTVAPNPASTEFGVNMTCDKMELYSASGALSAVAENASSMNVSALDEGIYLLRATVGKSVVIKRIVVKR